MTRAETKGVAFIPPPIDLLPSITDALTVALAQLPPDARGAVVGVATDTGVNAAIVSKLPSGWAVQAWVGKTWTSPTMNMGAQVMKTW